MRSEELDGSFDRFAHLRQPASDLCWWCGSKPATTGEHKFKRSDMARLMEGSPSLVWGYQGSGVTRELRGQGALKRDRCKVLKFPKSLCDTCNNSTSQPFDYAYDQFSSYLGSHNLRWLPGVPLGEIYGSSWPGSSLALARYYAKHFGCRMVRAGVPVPRSLVDFMNGASDMSDGHMVFVTTDSVHRVYRQGLYISPDGCWADHEQTRFVGYVGAAYVGSLGVRYEWREGGFPDALRSQLFHFPHPVINCYTDEYSVAFGGPRQPGWFARLSQWVNKPR